MFVDFDYNTCIHGVHDSFQLSNAPNCLFRFYIVCHLEQVMITTLNKLSIYK